MSVIKIFTSLLCPKDVYLKYYGVSDIDIEIKMVLLCYELGLLK